MRSVEEIDEVLDGLIVKCVSGITIKKDDLNLETDLVTDCGFDSVSIITLIVSIEDEFGFSFEDEMLVIDKMKRYSWLKEYVEGKVLGKNVEAN